LGNRWWRKRKKTKTYEKGMGFRNKRKRGNGVEQMTRILYEYGWQKEAAAYRQFFIVWW
jgi:hypothetical protein